MSTARGSASAELLELDLLRGCAAILMIVNHAGNQLLDEGLQHSAPMAALLFIGSFAPVLFFFSTGFGVAVSRQSRGAPPAMLGVLQKAGLLFVADQFFYWRIGVGFGLDFLGFIALASVLCSWVVARPNRFAIACVAAVAIAGLRFGLGPRIAAIAPYAWVNWLTGANGVAKLSYPFAPWMALPALGLAVGLHYPDHNAAPGVARTWRWATLGVAALFFALSGAAYLIGASFFRWGTMGWGFFLLCFAMIAAWGCLSVAVARASPPAARLLGLRGVASFVVVPVHYVAIDLAGALIGRRLLQAEFVVAAIALVVFSCGLSKIIARAAQRLVAPGRTAVTLGLVGIALVCALMLQWPASGPTGARMALMVAGQLAIAGLLGARAIRRATARA